MGIKNYIVSITLRVKLRDHYVLYANFIITNETLNVLLILNYSVYNVSSDIFLEHW